MTQSHIKDLHSNHSLTTGRKDCAQEKIKRHTETSTVSITYTNQKTHPTSTPHTNPPIQTAKDMNATRKDTMKEGEKKGSVGGRGAMEMGLEDSDNDQVFMDEVA